MSQLWTAHLPRAYAGRSHSASNQEEGAGNEQASFGLDSVVPVSSGLVILWQFRHRLPQSRERRALQLMGLSFFALAAYVTFESARTLLGGHVPEASPVGMGMAVASLLIMPVPVLGATPYGSKPRLQGCGRRFHADPVVAEGCCA